MIQFLSENSKTITIGIVIIFSLYLLFFGGGLIQTIFDIGKQIGRAIAQWN